MDKEKEYYNVEQAAKLLDVSKRTIRNRIQQGKLEGEKISGPYGQQYRLPADQFNYIPKEIQEVRPVQVPISAEKFREEVHREVREAVRDVVQEAVLEARKAKEEASALQERIDHLEARDQKLMEAIREKQAQEEDGPSLWKRLRSWFR